MYARSVQIRTRSCVKKFQSLYRNTPNKYITCMLLKSSRPVILGFERKKAQYLLSFHGLSTNIPIILLQIYRISDKGLNSRLCFKM
jgi:hypothetical protein